MCYWEKKQPQYIDRKKPDKERKAMKEAYKREYWQGVKNGTIRRGIQFKTVATSKPGEPLTFKVIYEDQPGYDEASFLIP